MSDPIDDPYAGNPQFPPSIDEPWTYYIDQATQTMFPRIRAETDYVIGRLSTSDPISNLYWNEEVLGVRPDAEIEALARQMAGEDVPGVAHTPAMGTTGEPAPAIPPRPDIALYAPMNPGDAALPPQ